MVAPLLAADPRQLGSYWLAGRLGAGGQGVVYEGYDEQGGRVAVKALHGDFVTDGYREQLRREVAALSRVAPFCTARIVETDLGHAPPYLVSEYVPGPDLQEWVDRNGAYGSDDLFRLAIGIATALASIHQAGVMHRDLKPANVLLGPDGPRVIDFGIARTEEMSRSATGNLKGTPRWMAPELYQGQRATPAVDIWAWGAIVLFAARGKPPFDGESLPALVHQIQNRDPDLERLHEPLRSLVGRSLSRDPASRPDARELLEGLIGGHSPLKAGTRAAGGLPSATIPPSLAQQAERAYARLHVDAQAAVPRVLLRMIAAFPDAQDTLRKVQFNEFIDAETPEPLLRQVLDELARAGLVIRDGIIFSLASPALLRAWPRLRDWVEQERAVLNVHHGLADAARLWAANGRKGGDLLQGSALDEVITTAIAGRHHLTLNVLEREFVDASVAASRRRTRVRTLLSGALAVLLVVAIGAAATATVQGGRLSDRNREISRQRDEAYGARIAGVASTMRRTDPVSAKRLAIAAGALAPNALDTRSALTSLYNQWEQSTYKPPGIDGTWRQTSDRTGHLRVFSRPNEVKIFDVDARKVTAHFAIPGQPVVNWAMSHPLSISDDGRFVALAQEDGRQKNGTPRGAVRVWNTATGQPGPVTIRLPEAYAELSPKGTRLLSFEAEQAIVWDVATGRSIVKIKRTQDASAIMTPDDRYLIAWLSGKLEVWDLTTGRKAPAPRLPKSKPQAYELSVSPDGKLLGTLVGDRLWLARLDRDEVWWRPVSKDFRASSMSFSSDGRYVAANATIWEVNGSRKEPVFAYASDEGTRCSFGPGDRVLRCIDGDGLITDVSLKTFLDPVSLSDGVGDSSVISEDGSTLAAGSTNGLTIWDPIKRVEKATLPLSVSNDTSDLEYSLSRDGRLLANTRRDTGDIEIWDARSATKKTTLRTGHKIGLYDPVVFSPDARTLAVLSGETGPKTLELFDVAKGSLRAKSAGADGGKPGNFPKAYYPKVLFSPDGRTVISSSDQGVVDVATGKRLVAPNPQLNEPKAISRDGLVAEADGSSKMEIWDARTLAPRYEMRLGLAIDETVAYSPDGQVLAAADRTAGVIRLWDVRNRRPFGLPLTGYHVPKGAPGGKIGPLAFTADGSAILSLDFEGRLRTHLVGPTQIKAALCKEVGPLTQADWKTYIPELPYRRTC
ncbi:protein kinase [Spirillospora sp. NPDC048911]|uniref:protein kinase domain-containing protein n=1 Tax=Spirillospora sp. NPDC048911 TaxID=3364527 RepID=UPI0037221F48